MRTKRAWSLGSIGLAMCAVLAGAGVARSETVAQGNAQGLSDLAASDVVQKWGIRILGLHPSAAGYVLDFRYSVVDPVKARPVLDRSVKPYLIDEASGRTLIVPAPPKVGSLRTSGIPVAGRNYFVLFGNPGKAVTRGNKVTVVIGALRIPDIVVE